MFDLDGTVVDSSRELFKAYSRAFAQWGLAERNQDWILKRSGFTADQVFVQNGASPDLVHEIAASFRSDLLDWVGTETDVYEDALMLLRKFAADEVPCVVVTNRPKHLASLIIKRRNLANHFENVFGSDGLNPKPSPEILKAALSSSRVKDASKAVMIGDSWMDIEAGHAAGVMTVAISRKHNQIARLSASRPDVLVRNLSDWGHRR